MLKEILKYFLMWVVVLGTLSILTVLIGIALSTVLY